MTKINTLQNFDETVLSKEIDMIHERLLIEYEEQCRYIRPDNLVEIEYNDNQQTQGRYPCINHSEMKATSFDYSSNRTKFILQLL